MDQHTTLLGAPSPQPQMPGPTPVVPAAWGGFCRGKWWQHNDKRRACILAAKDCLSLQSLLL